jgi:prepilin-type processing-associated H-X9-DG protein
MSMLSWFNGSDTASVGPGYVIYHKTTDIVKPGPSKTFVLVHERPDSINDGELYSNMQGYDPYQPSSWILQDIPSNCHDGACGAAFADGHSEIHKWKDAVLNARWPFAYQTAAPNSQDVYWIMDHATRKP